MIAEIYGKMVSNNSEDELTGNFLGILRYVSFKNLFKKILLDSIRPQSIVNEIEGLNYDEWSDYVEFWPYDEEGELDVLIDFPEISIGIEVKYQSGLSSDDNVDNSAVGVAFKNSCNQLAREARILQKCSGLKKLLIFIAPATTCDEVYEDVIKRRILPPDVLFGCIKWQDILSDLRKISVDGKYEQTVIEDLIALLELKGFDAFKNFSFGDIQVDSEQYYKF